MAQVIGAVLLVALGATACRDGGGSGGGSGGGADDDAGARTGGGAPGAPPSTEIEEPLPRPKSTVPLTITPPPIKPPSGPTDRLKPITVTGTLAEPVPGCLVVEADNGRWELAGALPEGFHVGDRVTVTGRPAAELEGSCGAPVIRVRAVRSA